MKDNNNTFHFVYSASQQEEIRKIREKYIVREEDKMERLRQLDESTTKVGSMVSIIVGVMSSLIFGIGMCCCMALNVKLFFLGIILGIIGLCGAVVAYPLYFYITEKQQQKMASEIIKLADELMK